jgi:hypothetical protein
MNKHYRIFFAIPFDSATKNLYERIRKKIKKRYNNLKITTIIGNEEVGPPPKYSDIATFKSQNREMTERFVGQIRIADVIVADLTHNNPNVHVELGIALMENKNILRVTGRSVSELGFDIRNLEVFRYKNETQLTDRITKYLDTFIKIKQLQISKRYGNLYYQELKTIHLKAMPKKNDSPNTVSGSFACQPACPHNFVLRDGAIQVRFKIIGFNTPEDWFGIFLRSADFPPTGSHLVYIRQNGWIELAVYPDFQVLKKVNTHQLISGKQDLFIQFENNCIDVRLGDAQLSYDKLTYQAVGRVFHAAYEADVDVYSTKMICRDTIEWD